MEKSFYPLFRPFKMTLKNAFLSTICMSYVRQRSSTEQWEKEEFLALKSLLPQPEESNTDEEGTMILCKEI